jgi:hypothetical protein
MEDFSRAFCSFAAVTIFLGISVALTDAQAGVTGGRTGGQRGNEQHKSSDPAGGIRVTGKDEAAANCSTSLVDRMVGGQRVWTQHGVITVGGRIEKVLSTECR